MDIALTEAADSLARVSSLASGVQELADMVAALIPPGTSDWDPNHHYNAGDIVLSDQRLWVAELGGAGPRPSLGSGWREYKVGEPTPAPAPGPDVKVHFHLSDGTDGGMAGYLYATTNSPPPAFNPRAVGARAGRGWMALGCVVGSDGTQGPAGPQGAPGPQGPAGPAGRDGTAVAFRGILDNSNGLPTQVDAADLFIAGATVPKKGWPGGLSPAAGNGLLYDGSRWLDVGPLRGPEGPAGPLGPVGPQGAQGLPGAAGQAGTPGPQGLQGEVGPTGPAGRDGRDGVDGATGQDGFIRVHLGDGISGGDGLLYVTTDRNAGGFPPNTTGTGHVAPPGWVDLGTIEGPPGRQGPRGQRGPTPVFAMGTGQHGSIPGMLYYTSDEPALPFTADNFDRYRPVGRIGPRTFVSDITIPSGGEMLVGHGLGSRDVLVQLHGNGIVIYDALIRIVDENSVGVTAQIGGHYRLQVYRAF